MTHKKVFTIPFSRKRERRTDYKARLAMLKSDTLRLVVRKSNKHIQVQLINYVDKGDIVLKSAHSRELEKFGWKISTSNIPAAYLVGLLIGRRAKGKEAIFDLGLQSPKAGSK